MGNSAGGTTSAEGGSVSTGGTVACRAKVTRTASPRTTPRSKTPRIVGGHPSLAGVWPWAVALESSSGFQFCGATLYRSQWLVTAGHCEVRPGERAVLGRIDLRTSVGEVIKIDEVRTHELYVAADLGWDVSVAHLERPSLATPAPLVAPKWAGPGLYAMVVGWGLISEGAANTSPVLRETEVPLLAATTCSVAYPGVPGTAVCAGYPEGGKDTCQGDSGGGLFVQLDGWKQAGITSYGDGCARPGKPGVYTAVASVRDWIEACTRDP